MRGDADGRPQIKKQTRIGCTQMIEKPLDIDERFFADHKFETEIGLAEYELASRKLDGAEKAFLWAANTSTIFVPLVWFGGLRLQSEWNKTEIDAAILPDITKGFLVFSVILSLMALFHIIHLLRPPHNPFLRHIKDTNPFDGCNWAA